LTVVPRPAGGRGTARGHRTARTPTTGEGTQMLGYVARRLAMAVGTILAAVVISFLLVHAAKSSPGAVVLGPSGTPAEIAAKNHELGWDQPLVSQFFSYLGHLVRGDLGTSLIDNRSIATDL